MTGAIITPPNPKSKIIIGDITVFTSKRFNWFQKIMIRFCFGFEVKEVSE